MTFTEIVDGVKKQTNLSTTDATTRIGETVNRVYRRVTTAIGLNTTRRGTVSKTASIGVNTITFSGIEKIINVVDRSTTPYRVLAETTVEDMRQEQPSSLATPRKWALLTSGASTVTVMLDCVPTTTFTLYADGYLIAPSLTGSNVPAFPESYHEVLYYGTLADEWRKLNKQSLAKDADAQYEKILSDLKFFINKTSYNDIVQGKHKNREIVSTGSGGSGSGSVAAFTHIVDIRDFGAQCDGVTNVDTAVQTAISSGAKRIFLPKNTLWTPATNLIPGGVEYVGEDPEAVIIRSADTTNDYVTIGPKTVLRNVSIFDKHGTVNPGVLHPDGPPNVPRPIRYLLNSRLSNALSSHWSYQTWFLAAGDTATDIPGMSINSVGLGDGIFLAANESTVGMRIYAGVQEPTGTATGLLVQCFGLGSGIKVQSETGGVPTAGLIQIGQNTNCAGLYFAPSVATTDDIIYTSSVKTAGQVINMYQATSAFAGEGLHMNFGNSGGSFTGNYVVFAKNSVAKFSVAHDGVVTAIRYVGARTDTLVASTVTGAQNNLDILNASDGVVLWNGASDAAITGIVNAYTGQRLTVKNVTASAIVTFAHESGSSSAANQFSNIVTSAVTPVAPGGWITYVHNGSRWKLIDYEQGAWITPTFAAGDYTASSGSWTVDSGDVAVCRYRLSGKTLELQLRVNSTDVSATPTTLRRAIPGGFTSGTTGIQGPILVSDAGAATVFSVAELQASSIYFYATLAATNWTTTAADNTNIILDHFVFEVQ